MGWEQNAKGSNIHFLIIIPDQYARCILNELQFNPFHAIVGFDLQSFIDKSVNLLIWGDYLINWQRAAENKQQNASEPLCQ